MPKHLFPAQPFFRFHALALLALVALLGPASACSPAVGDECTSAQDCPAESGSVCDNTIEGGYCLIQDCEVGGCPADSVCVLFDRNTRYCMAICETDDECRAEFACRKDFNLEGSSVGYCYIPAEAPDESDADAGDDSNDAGDESSDATPEG
jgi:hypothetical protein